MANAVAAFGANLGKDVMLFVVVESATAMPDTNGLDFFLAAGAFNSRDKERERSKSDPLPEKSQKRNSKKAIDERCRRVGRPLAAAAKGTREKTKEGNQ